MVTLGAALLVVVVVKPDPEPEHARALEAACSDAVNGTCVLQNASDDQAPDAIAIVSVDARASRAIIQVGQEQKARSDWRRRTLQFASEDDPVERFRAIGLTIATLAGGTDQSDGAVAPKTKSPPKPADTRQEPAPTPAPAPPARPAPPEPVAWLRFAASVVSGPGLDRGPWRAGASLRSSFRGWSLPLEPTASASHSQLLSDHRELTAAWTRFTLGLALAPVYAPWDVGAALRVEGAYEGLLARQKKPADRGSRWVFGTLLGANVVWPASGLLGAYFHADLLSLEGGTELSAGGEHLASSPGNTYTLGVGVEVRLR